MGEIQAVVDALEDAQPDVQTIAEAGVGASGAGAGSGKQVATNDSTAMDTTTSDEPKKKRKQKAGIIGEGRKEPLSKAQRKRAL